MTNARAQRSNQPTFKPGPYRAHGPILGIDEAQDEAWLELFSRRCWRASLACIAGIIFCYGITFL